MGKTFKKANREAVDVYYFGDEPKEGQEDERDWIRVRASISKQEANAILSTAPTENRDIAGGLAFLERFADKVLVAWSLTDEEGNQLPATLENYREMDAAPASIIERKLSEHFNKLLGREVERLEGESST
jgi:hypothetical protein